MFSTPISHFLNTYGESGVTRLHMPGHKGAGFSEDITEVSGADALYEAEGIIRESEMNASMKFGSRSTFYGTEGSSQIIKAMCFLAIKWKKANGGMAETPVILATRNAHKAFIHAAMLLRFEIEWLTSEDEYDLCRCVISPEGLKAKLESLEDNLRNRLVAVFVTSPDYLGNILDIAGLAKEAHEAGLMLLVDNAHGSYLRFMEQDLHPISLGADLCADSAHKTLPVLTGGAYIHVSKGAPAGLEEDAKEALLLFGSTSPSYLILKSLDEANEKVTREGYIQTAERVRELKEKLEALGYSFAGDEPLKLTFDMREDQLNGYDLADALRKEGIEVEYAGPDFVVTMWTPWNEYPQDYDKLEHALNKIRAGMNETTSSDAGLDKRDRNTWSTILPEVRYQPWEVLLMPHKRVRVDDTLIGCTVYDAHVGCPPAVSPIVAGEVVDKNVLDILKYYGVTEVSKVEMRSCLQEKHDDFMTLEKHEE